MDPNPSRRLGAILSALLAAVYVGSWFNRYLGLTTDGWYYFFAQQWRAGLVPYRDFHLFTPPVFLFENAAAQALFGEQLIWIHFFGLAQRALLAGVIFLWTNRVAKPIPSLVATFATIVVFSGDVNEVVIYVTQDATFWAVLGGYLAAVSLGGERRSPRPWLLAASGFAASLAVLSKQTTGLAATAALGLAILVREPAWRSRLRSAATFVAGWLVPAIPVLLWLRSNGAVQPFLDQVFLKGGASKGGLVATLLRPWTALLGPGRFAPLAVLALLVLLVGWALGRQASGRPTHLSPNVRLLLASLGLLVVLVAAVPLASVPRNAQGVACYVAFFGSIAVTLIEAAKYRRDPGSQEAWDKLLLAGFSALLAYSCTISFPLWEGMVVPGLAPLVAVALERDPRITSDRSRARAAIAALTVAVILVLSIGSKSSRPYAWGQWYEPALSESTVEPVDLPQLAGFRLSPATVEKLGQIVTAIREHSSPADPVFVYPHVPFLYSLAERRPPTFAYVHFIDVAPDEIVQRDLDTLRRKPPRVIAMFTREPGNDPFNQWLFRGGRRSAQRDMAAYLRELGGSAAYETVLDLPLHEVMGTIRVYAQRPPPS